MDVLLLLLAVAASVLILVVMLVARLLRAILAPRSRPPRSLPPRSLHEDIPRPRPARQDDETLPLSVRARPTPPVDAAAGIPADPAGPWIGFEVQGSARRPYLVEFTRDGDRFVARCTCPAAGKGLHCKHRNRILLRAVTEPENPDFDELRTLLDGTAVPDAVAEWALTAEWGEDGPVAWANPVETRALLDTYADARALHRLAGRRAKGYDE